MSKIEELIERVLQLEQDLKDSHFQLRTYIREITNDVKELDKDIECLCGDIEFLFRHTKLPGIKRVSGTSSLTE